MAIKITRFAGFLVLAFLSFLAANGQQVNYTKGQINIDVFISNPCGGGPSNGFMKFTLNHAQGGAAGSVNIQIFGPVNQGVPVTVPVGGTFTFNAGKTLPAGTYNLLILDNNGPDIINSFASDPPVVLTALAAITISDAVGNNLANASCSSPNGKIGFDIAGGSKILVGGGSFNYTLTSTNAVVGFPLSGTYDGTATLDLTTLLNAAHPPITGLPGGTYSLTITDNYSVCGAIKSWVITDPSPLVFNTSAATPSVCLGQSGTVQLSGSENAAVVYKIFRNGVATAITLNGTNGLLNFTIPTALLTPVGSYSFTILATNGICTPTFMNLTAVINVNALPVPTITGPATACVGSAGVNYTTEVGKSAYVWSVVGGTITSGAGTNSILVTWTTAGAQSVSINYMDVNGCSAASPTTKPVTVNPAPTPTITGSASVCIGASGVTYVTEVGKAGYLWNVVGGNITAGAGTNSITVTWTTAGPQSVSINYTDASGCTAASPTAKLVTVNALPIPTISGPASTCLNSTSGYTTEVGNSAYVWTVSPGGTITAGAGTSSVTISWTSLGVKTVSVKYTDVNGCTASIPTTKSVTVNSLPVPTITGSNNVCIGAAGVTYTTEVGNSVYSWSVSAGGTITSGAGTSSIAVTWNTSGPQTVSVNYTDVNGCTALAPTVKNITVNPPPLPTITGLATVCLGAVGVVYTTEVGKAGYLWTIVGGVITAGAGTSSITVTWNTAGPENVKVNYTDVNGCTAASPTTKTVTVNPPPVPTITGNASVCLNSVGNTYTTESGNSTYLWSVTGGTITAGAGTNVITVTWTTVGAESVSINYTNVNGCAAAAPTVSVVTVNALPTPTITGPVSVCVGAIGNTYVTEVGKTAYAWSVVGGTISSGAGTNSITVNWTTPGAQSVSVNYSDVNNCTAVSPTTKAVTVHALPVPAIAGTGSVCVNSAGNTYSTASGNSAYAWSVSAGGSITSGAGTNIITVTWNTIGAQSVSVNFTDVNGCSAAGPTTKPVTVNPLPVPTVAGPVSACVNSPGNTYTTQAGNSGYIWSVVGGAITSGGGTNSIVVTWTSLGAQSVSVNFTDVNGCIASSPTVQPVTVIAQPAPTIAGTTSICVGSTGIVYSTQAGESGYLWSVTGGSITSGLGTNSITVNWTSSGAQTVSVNYTAASGCTASSPTVITVTVNALPVPTIAGPGSVCINSAGNVYTTQPGNSSYLWTVSAGGNITAGGGTNAITVTWTAAGAQLVSITYTDANGCVPSSATSKGITVSNLPVPTITGPSSVCAGASGVAYTTESGDSGYSWTIGGGAITSGLGTNTITVTWGAAGPGSLTITYVDANGCVPASPTTLNATINPSPNATIVAAGPFCSNDLPVNLTATTPGGTWSGTGITNPAAGTFDPATAGPGIFTITYTVTIGGCTDTKTRNIQVNPAPNATITPAGPFCITDPATNLTAVTGGGTWSGTGITNAAAGTFAPATAGVGTFVITYVVVSGSGCTDTKTASITVGNAPNATITPAGPFCTNDAPVNLAAATPGGTWSGTGITNAAAGTFDPHTAGVGTFTITYSIVTGGCSDTKTTSIQVNLGPDATITPAGPFCFTDAPFNLVAATPGGTWSGSGITNTANGTFDPSIAGVGTFSISYSVTLGSCTDVKSTNITVANPPNATITPAGPFCNNDLPVNLVAVTPGGVWSGTGITNSAAGTFNPISAGVGTFTITYSITIGGCSDTKTKNIQVNLAPDATFNPAGPFCITDAAVNLVSLNPGGTWSGTGVTNAATGTFDPSVAGPGIFAVTYTLTSGGCTDMKSINMTISNPPDATITPAGPFCTGSAPVNLSAVTPGGTWSGTGITNVVAGTFDPSASGAGTFTITYTVAIGGCNDTKTANIQVNAGPVVTITPAGPFCLANPSLNLTSSAPGGTWSGTGITDPVAGTFDPSTAGVGTSVITYSVTAGGCTTTATTSIIVNAVCGGVNCGAFNVTITDTRPSCALQDDGTIAINVVGGIPNYVVTLTDAGGAAQALPGPGPVFNFINLSPSAYQYTVQDASGNTCTLPYALLLQTNVVATATNFVAANCLSSGGSATLTVVSGGTSPYEYSTDSGATWISFTSPVTITNLVASATPYAILVRDDPSDLCIDQLTVTISGPAASLDTLYVNKTISVPDQPSGSMLVGIKESGEPSYQVRLELTTPLFAGQTFLLDWTNAVRNPQNLHVEYDAKNLYAGQYTLSIRDSLGCEKDYLISINVDTNIFIPNIFTPNGDNINDIFFIRNMPNGTTVIITNRWGKEVYSSIDYQNDWGAANISDGVYYYRIRASGKVFTGWLEIARNQ